MDNSEEIKNLKNRVGYLERELAMNYEEDKFKRDVSNLLCHDDATIEISDSLASYHARFSDINGEDVQLIIDRIDDMNSIGKKKYDYAVTETGNGLGMEVWADNRNL